MEGKLMDKSIRNQMVADSGISQNNKLRCLV